MTDTPLQIGRYTILERLAVGGMAQVYLGFETGDTALQRLVVIKQILPKHCEDESFKKMSVRVPPRPPREMTHIFDGFSRRKLQKGESFLPSSCRK